MKAKPSSCGGVGWLGARGRTYLVPVFQREVSEGCSVSKLQVSEVPVYDLPVPGREVDVGGGAALQLLQGRLQLLLLGLQPVQLGSGLGGSGMRSQPPGVHLVHVPQLGPVSKLLGDVPLLLPFQLLELAMHLIIIKEATSKKSEAAPRPACP